MSVRVKCPSCEESFDLVDTLIGRRVKCRHCQQPFVAAAEAPDAADLGAAIQDQPRRVAAQARRDDDAESPRRRADRADDDRDDDRDGDRPRRRDRDDDKPRGTPWGWIVGGIAAVFVVSLVAVLGVVAIVLFFRFAPQQQGAMVAIADNPDQGKMVQLDPRPGPDPIPKKEPPRKDPPKKDPIPDPFKEPVKDPFKDPVKKDVEEVPWAYTADPGPQIKAPAKAGEFLSFFGNPQIVFPRTPSPFVAVRHGQFPNEGWQVFDLEKCKLIGQIQAKIELEKEALSPDGSFLAGKGRGPNFQQSVINVHSVSNGGKIARTFTMDTNAAALRWIDFLEDDHMLTYKTHGITAHFEIWNAAGQCVQHITLQGLLDERERMCLSPGRKYFAVAEDKAIHIFHATEGKKVGMLRPPIGFSAYTGMAFSPDGQELAVYGSAFASSSQMLVYKLDRGELVINHKFAKDVGTMVKNRFGYKGQPLEWIPDKSGWLMFGQMLIDYVSGAPVYDISWPPQEFSYFPRRFIGPDYVVATSKDVKGARMGYLALPRDTIAKAVQQARGGDGGAALADLPAIKTGDVAGAAVLPNPGGNVAWKVEPDPVRAVKAALGQKSIALRGSAQNVQ